MKTGHNTNTIRFDIDLTPEDIEALEAILVKCHRNRKSFGESLVKLALTSHKNGHRFVDLEQLGLINI